MSIDGAHRQHRWRRATSTLSVERLDEHRGAIDKQRAGPRRIEGEYQLYEHMRQAVLQAFPRLLGPPPPLISKASRACAGHGGMRWSQRHTLTSGMRRSRRHALVTAARAGHGGTRWSRRHALVTSQAAMQAAGRAKTSGEHRHGDGAKTREGQDTSRTAGDADGQGT